MQTATVIYHSADYDGIFCREIAKHFLPDATLIGWNFGDPLLHWPTEGPIYLMDLPVDKVFGSQFSPLMRDKPVDPLLTRLVWIDHHKSSIETHPVSIPGYRIDGVAACRLAWQWFTASVHDVPLPSKEDFVNRAVNEPKSVQLAGEYDIWDKRNPDAETFQYALRAAAEIHWEKMFDYGSDYYDIMLEDGAPAQRYQQKMDEDLVMHRSYRLNWEGLNFIVLNTGRFNSLTFAALDKPETGHDALLGYMFNGKCWTVSLYHARHRKDIDLSQIAVKHGGGGHHGAAGFTCATFPFQT